MILDNDNIVIVDRSEINVGKIVRQHRSGVVWKGSLQRDGREIAIRQVCICVNVSIHL